MDHPPVGSDSASDRITALEAFERITRAWAEMVDGSESQAYGQLRKDLMDNSAILISGGLMTAKEVLDKLEDLQNHIKKGGTGGRSVLDEFHSFFNEESA